MYNVPNFNRLMGAWIGSTLPADWDVPDQADIPCQIYIASRGLLDIEPGTPDFWVPPIQIRVQADMSENQIRWWRDNVTGQRYFVRWWHMQHIGFINQYGLYICEMVDSSGTPSRYLTPD